MRKKSITYTVQKKQNAITNRAHKYTVHTSVKKKTKKKRGGKQKNAHTHTHTQHAAKKKKTNTRRRATIIISIGKITSKSKFIVKRIKKIHKKEQIYENNHTNNRKGQKQK